MYEELSIEEKRILEVSRLKSFRFYYLKQLYEIHELVSGDKPDPKKIKEYLVEEMRHMKSLTEDEVHLLMDGITVRIVEQRMKKQEIEQPKP